MRTYLIAYDLANPARNKHALASSIMAAGERWARPLEQTWYLTSPESEETLAERLGSLIDSDDGLLIQSVDDQAVLTNTSLRWFRQRRTPATAVSNVVAFPVQQAPVQQAPAPQALAPQLPAPDEQPELPLARAG